MFGETGNRHIVHVAAGVWEVSNASCEGVFKGCHFKSASKVEENVLAVIKTIQKLPRMFSTTVRVPTEVCSCRREIFKIDCMQHL